MVGGEEFVRDGDTFEGEVFGQSRNHRGGELGSEC